MSTQLSATERADAEQHLLELLGDEYTRRVLAAVTEQPRCGNEVIDAADVSKATAYRRLDDLESAGLIGSEMVFDPDGHHRERFHTVVEAIDIEFTPDSISATVETGTDDSETGPPYRR
jgi:predicted transcriptional regulator